MKQIDSSLRAFFSLWIAQSLSLLGSNATQFALIWWLTATTGSAPVLAAATFLGLVPQIVLGPVIGALVDRWNRKRIMFWADVGVAIAALVLAYLFWRESVAVTHVLALLFVRAVGSAFHGPAMFASTALMVPDRLLTKIQGLNQMVLGSGLVIGAPMGALLYAWLPMSGVMLVDVGTALVAAAPLALVHVPQPPAANGETGDASPERVLDAMRAGLRWVTSRRGATLLVLAAAFVNLLLVPAMSLLPLLVAEAGRGAGSFAAMSASLGVGMLAGGVLLGAWGGFRRRIHTSLAGMTGLGAATLAIGSLASHQFFALGATFVLGVAVSLTNGPIHAILQSIVEPALQGRVFTLVVTLATAMTPIGLLAAVPFAELMGAQSWYVASGAACVAVSLAAFFSPALVNIEGHGPPLGVDRAGSNIPET